MLRTHWTRTSSRTPWFSFPCPCEQTRSGCCCSSRGQRTEVLTLSSTSCAAVLSRTNSENDFSPQFKSSVKFPWHTSCTRFQDSCVSPRPVWPGRKVQLFTSVAGRQDFSMHFHGAQDKWWPGQNFLFLHVVPRRVWMPSSANTSKTVVFYSCFYQVQPVMNPPPLRRMAPWYCQKIVAQFKRSSSRVTACTFGSR